MILSELFDAIRNAWCAETAAPGTDGAGSSCPNGQCAVTALLVQDLIGGAILRAEVNGVGHYWNLIHGMGEIDLTRDQFSRDTAVGRGDLVPRSRLLEGERAAAARTAQRYELFRNRVDAA